MTFEQYLAMPETEQKQYHVGRTCDLCDGPLVKLNGHTTGALHAVCPACKHCPDCEDGE